MIACESIDDRLSVIYTKLRHHLMAQALASLLEAPLMTQPSHPSVSSLLQA